MIIIIISYASSKATKICIVICTLVKLLQSRRPLEQQALCGILTLRRIYLRTLEKFRIAVLVGCVEADSIPILQHGHSLPVIVVMSFIGLHFPPIESIYQYPLYSI